MSTGNQAMVRKQTENVTRNKILAENLQRTQIKNLAANDTSNRNRRLKIFLPLHLYEYVCGFDGGGVLGVQFCEEEGVTDIWGV